MSNLKSPRESLEVLDPKAEHTFILPVKRIHDGDDVDFFLASRAYADIMTFIFQLNASMFPRRIVDEERTTPSIKEWKLEDPDVLFPPIVQSLAKLLGALNAIIDEVPPDTGPRRFGNISFRRWYELVIERIPDLISEHVPSHIFLSSSTSEVTAKAELEAYLIGSFGSSQRLDYGTGHELSFLAFLGCLWKLGGFPETANGGQERAIVLGVIEPYASPMTSCSVSKLTILQLSATDPAPDINIHTRTCRVPRSLGPGRPLIPSLHLRLCTVLTSNIVNLRHCPRRLTTKRTQPS
jgi:serine/threonine-protein phosphatase 2A activator